MIQFVAKIDTILVDRTYLSDTIILIHLLIIIDNLFSKHLIICFTLLKSKEGKNY